MASAVTLASECGIYAIVHVPTGRRYIGQSQDIQKRWSYHKARLKSRNHHCIYLQRIYNKHGAASFQYIILQRCSTLFLDRLESKWFARTPPDMLINIHPPGKSARGYKASEETRAKLSISAKRVGLDPEERRRRSERAKAQHAAGKLGQQTWSPEVKQKMAEVGRQNLIKHGDKGRALAIGDSAEMSRRSYQRKLFKQ